MKKLMILGMGVCVALAFTSCKSSESAYKKAYEKAKEQELATSNVPVETTPVVNTPVEAPVVVERTPVAPEAGVRQEKVTLVSGSELKDYSVICGSFGLKTNAEAVRDNLASEGYNPLIVFNAETATYRVVVATYPDRTSAAAARDLFKERYPNNKDFQGAWLLYRLY